MEAVENTLNGTVNGVPEASSNTARASLEEPVATENDLGFKVGQRVQSIGKGPTKTGTVKYVGPVQGYQGLWVGVDWDDGEGRHNGTVNGVHYFDTAGEMSGSFVRSHSLSKGITLLEALIRRYREQDSTKEEEDEMYVLSARQKRVAIELVGLNKIHEKQKQLENLFHASLEYAGVNSLGSSQEIRAIAPNLEELDLRGNLLPDWQSVGVICEALLSLKVLDLSNSRIRFGLDSLPVFCNLRTLVLNNCGITWEQVEMLKNSVPSIEELHLGGNKLRTIEPSIEQLAVSSINSNGTFVQGFNSLRLLSLEGNNIERWEEIVKLSQLRRLEQLHLSNNKLRRIFYPESPKLNLNSSNGSGLQKGCLKPFENLHCLLLGGNKIEDWASVDSLSSFPSLTEVRLSENPISDPTSGGGSRYILIARLGKITILNGSEVKQRERRDSEIRYVRLIMATMQTKSQEEILQHHPRFVELKALHDLPDEIVHVGVAGPQKMAAGLLSITLTCVAASIGEKAPITKKLPPTTTVGKLKLLCEGFFKLKPVKQRLFLEEQESPVPTPLNDDMETLIDLGVGTSGATILVDEVED